jgi:hypothetical protein
MVLLGVASTVLLARTARTSPTGVLP